MLSECWRSDRRLCVCQLGAWSIWWRGPSSGRGCDDVRHVGRLCSLCVPRDTLVRRQTYDGRRRVYFVCHPEFSRRVVDVALRQFVGQCEVKAEERDRGVARHLKHRPDALAAAACQGCQGDRRNLNSPCQLHSVVSLSPRVSVAVQASGSHWSGTPPQPVGHSQNDDPTLLQPEIVRSNAVTVTRNTRGWLIKETYLARAEPTKHDASETGDRGRNCKPETTNQCVLDVSNRRSYASRPATNCVVSQAPVAQLVRAHA